MNNNYNDEYYSIVAAYNQNGNLWYYRLADIDTESGKIIEATYNTDDDSYVYEPVTLYSKDPNKIEYKPIILKWKYDEFDERKQYTEKCELKGKIYELAFLSNNVIDQEYNENKIRNILSTGFHISNSLNNDFLLVISQSNNSYTTLLCTQKMFKEKKEINESNSDIKCIYFDKNSNDLLNSQPVLDIYNIPYKSIVSNEALLDHPFSKSIDIEYRYFFDSLQLPKKQGTFLLKNADDYTLTFFKKYLKEMKDVLSLSNKDRTKFINIIQSIDKSKELIEEFKEHTGYNTEVLLESFSKKGAEVVNSISKENEMFTVLKDFLISDQKFYDSCLSQIKIDWENSSDFKDKQKKREERELSLLVEIDQTTNELNTLKDTIKQFHNEKEQLLEEKEQLLKEQVQLNNNITELKVEKYNVTESINKALNEYKTDIVTVIKNVAPLELVKQSNISEIPKGYLHQKNKDAHFSQKVKFYEGGSIQDFYEDLEENISLYYTDNRSCEITASILASILCKKALVVDECIGETIADCISCLCDKKPCDRYIIHKADIDVSKLYCSLKENKNQIIYINGILNLFNEQLMKQLIKLFPKKIFIFSIDEENMGNLSRNLWKYATYIDLEKNYSDINNSSEIIISNYNINELNYTLPSSIKDKKITQNPVLSDYQKVEISKILNYYSDFIKSEITPTFCINQIILNMGINREKTQKVISDLYSEETISDSIIDKVMEDTL
ncbi:hypothetical protein [Holdemanella sp. MSK.7.32]|uniref:hypothetical protein n=1 Tax=Holdemanella sp. MSK.7.32 TaxID=2965273 RepID=UPI00210BDC7F|nr:hypothetical protein [Holdemanella sp. MSK.7.32]MCQ4804578.1 hypothetical protein [Holdemanella sp. MSK.7.32]